MRRKKARFPALQGGGFRSTCDRAQATEAARHALEQEGQGLSHHPPARPLTLPRPGGPKKTLESHASVFFAPHRPAKAEKNCRSPSFLNAEINWLAPKAA